ncbi:MAG: hypothetical protein ACI9WL_000067 [Rubritalea sp.]|jgi:hypothetical protein
MFPYSMVLEKRILWRLKKSIAKNKITLATVATPSPSNYGASL